MKEAIVSTFMHILELLVVLGVTVVLIKVLNVESGTVEALIALVLAAITKFVRASDIPIGDYVNDR